MAPTHEDLSSILDSLGEAGQELLNTLDSQFFEYPDNLTELLFEYVSHHPEAFGRVPPGEVT